MGTNSAGESYKGVLSGNISDRPISGKRKFRLPKFGNPEIKNRKMMNFQKKDK